MVGGWQVLYEAGVILAQYELKSISSTNVGVKAQYRLPSKSISSFGDNTCGHSHYAFMLPIHLFTEFRSLYRRLRPINIGLLRIAVSMELHSYSNIILITWKLPTPFVPYSDLYLNKIVLSFESVLVLVISNTP